ncbi:sugar ABC transporter permease [Glycomyces albidus]|uniref:Uncharacterized protein n=1 Tax=Glycomyces albidus TaxID=2656774 RepID=A0A6L5G8F7_9ACTN|nr:sugar ABC transporter permease [Glycomyces albidus]MQM25944.1 hypothetical protein [Glycomyces albidus]
MVLQPGAGTPPPDDPTLAIRQARPVWPLPPPPANQFTGPQIQPRTDAARVAGGIGLLVVPIVAFVLAYLVPTFRTIALSRAEGSRIFDEEQSIGPANYEEVFSEGLFFDGIAHLAGPIAVIVFAGAVLAPFLAWLVHRSGAGVRGVSRVLWALAAVSFTPAALSTAWLIERVVSESSREASVYDWTGLIAGVVLGLGVLAGLAAQRAGDGRRTGPVLVVAGLSAIVLVATGLQTFAFGSLSGLPAGAPTPVAQILDGIHFGLSEGVAIAKGVLLLCILAVLGLGAAVLFAAARLRIDVEPGPDGPARPAAAVAAVVLLIAALAVIGSFLSPWLSRLGEGGEGETDWWFLIRHAWGRPLAASAIGVGTALIGGFALGALRPFGAASRWALLAFAPWLLVGSAPLAAAHLDAISPEPGEFLVIGWYMPRVWIAIPALFLFTALFWGLEDRRRAALAQGAPPRAARAAFIKAAWPFAVLLLLAALLVNANDLVWQQATWQDLAGSAMAFALEEPDFEHSGVALGYPVPVLAGYALAAAALAIWYLPRLVVRTGRS